MPAVERAGEERAGLDVEEEGEEELDLRDTTSHRERLPGGDARKREKADATHPVPSPLPPLPPKAFSTSFLPISNMPSSSLPAPLGTVSALLPGKAM